MTTNTHARILADSITTNGNRLTTFEIRLPKVLLSEINTHRAFSRNYSSSRAIPTTKFVEIDSFRPTRWLKNQAGMVAKDEEVYNPTATKLVWEQAIEASKEYSNLLADFGLHKQWANRPNDWHSIAKGVVSATEWNNFLWLRADSAAQPEMQELAEQIKELLAESQPQVLQPGEWHLPYVKTQRDLFELLRYYDNNNVELSEEDAITYSMACCAAVSYRTENIGLEKANDIYKKLFTGAKVHASPSEHIATPMQLPSTLNEKLEYMVATEGVTHLDRYQNLWSGNFKGFIQFRQLIANNVKLG